VAISDPTFFVEWSTVGIILTIVTAVSSLTWWLSGQFSAVRQLVFERIGTTEKILSEKMEYHERHDDERFAQIRNDLSEVRIRNAAKDALMATIISRLDKLNGKHP